MDSTATPAAVGIVQQPADRLRPGSMIRLPGETQWRLLVEVVTRDNTGCYAGVESVEEVADLLDGWYVALCMNDLPNRLAARGGKLYRGRSTDSEYEPDDPGLLLEVVFVGALVDVQVDVPARI